MPTENLPTIIKAPPRPLRRLRAPSGRPAAPSPSTLPGVQPEQNQPTGPQRPSPR